MFELIEIYILCHITLHVVIDYITDYLNSDDPYY